MSIKKIIGGICGLVLSFVLVGCVDTTSDSNGTIQETETTEKQVVLRESWDKTFIPKKLKGDGSTGADYGKCDYTFLYYIYEDNTVEIIGQCYENTIAYYNYNDSIYDIGILSFDDSLYSMEMSEESYWNTTLRFKENYAERSFERMNNGNIVGEQIKITLTPKGTFTEKTQIEAFGKLITIDPSLILQYSADKGAGNTTAIIEDWYSEKNN